MNDKHLLIPQFDEHRLLFGENELKSLSADKGYWSSTNLKTAAKQNVDDID